MLNRENCLVSYQWWQKEKTLKEPLEVSKIRDFDQEGQEAPEDNKNFFQEIENQDEL